MIAAARALGWRLAYAIALASICISPVHAHKASDSYLAFTVSGSELHGRWDIALRDLDYAIGVDLDDDGAITWDELRTREPAIVAYALARLHLTIDGKPCTLSLAPLMVDRHSDGAYAVIRLSGQCAADVRSLAIDYRLFFDVDPQHRGLMQLVANGVTRTAIFSPERPRYEIASSTSSREAELLAFAREGVWHIWIGVDHLLFLCALLLPAMLVRTSGGWQPVPNASQAFWNVFRIVTSFTIAHSITLSLAVLQVAFLSSRWVESAIAASVLIAALNNIYPVVHRNLWIVAFGFGLIHGFGFASVLLDLGLRRESLFFSLLGFNLGVEVGQLAIVALYFVLAYGIRSSSMYRRALLSGGSAVIALIATVWMIERGLDLKVLTL
jgi:hypothetical protein